MKNKFTVIIPIAIAITFAAGIFIGNTLKQNSQPGVGGLHIGNTNKISTILHLIDQGYVDSVNVSEIVENTIPELFKNLDPHTSYIPAKNMQEVNEGMQGNFSGIGVQFSIQEDTVRVIDVISGGPSSKVGIMAGDRIVSVNDTVIAGISVNNQRVFELLRGVKGTKVNVGVLRAGYTDLFEFEIIRGDIPLFSVDVTYMIDEITGYIKVNRFAERTFEDFMKGVQKIDRLGGKKIIVDLRGNPGGYLGAVIHMLDEFLEKDELILYTKGVNQPTKTYTASGKNEGIGKELIVLIDEGSASASEIFAGALQDNDRAIIIGRRTFGKGLVQEQIPLSDGSAVRLTVARYYTPSGRCIQKSYDQGIDKYYEDLYDRMHHGEMQKADSIHFADSLRYTTKSGRTVYGGGGITPDIFVPIDTTGYSEYFAKLSQKGIIYQFAYSYTDTHRELLNNFTTAAEFNTYLDENNVLAEMIKYAESKGLPTDKKGLEESRLVINTQLKAYIARNIIGEEGFYPIIKEIDKTLLIAIEASHKNLLVENLNFNQK